MHAEPLPRRKHRMSLNDVRKCIRTSLIPSTLKNEDEQRRANLYIDMLLSMLITNIAGFCASLIDPSGDFTTIVISYSITLFELVACATILRLGKVVVAEWSLALFLWIQLACTLYFFGGLHSQIPAIFTVVVIFVGASLGGRWAVVFSFVTIAYFAFIGVLDMYNLIPPSRANMFSPINSWICLSVTFPLMAVLLRNLLHTARISEERYKLAIQGSNACVWDWNVVNQKMYLTYTFQSLLGYLPSEFPRTIKSFVDLIHPDDIEFVKNHFDMRYAVPGDKFDVEFRLRSSTGEYQWFHCKGEAASNSKSEIERVIGCLMEITDRKIAEEELKKTNSELDRFVYSASHDLRSPISSLMGLIQLMKNENDQAARAKICTLQERSLDKLDRYISDIVNYSRNNRLQVTAFKIDFDSIYCRVIDQLEFMPRISELDIQVYINEGIRFYSDNVRIEIILRNLMSNAILYCDRSKSDPYVRVSVDNYGDGIMIRVVDNGEGIGREHLDNVCKMFYRASDKSTGAGIGLYIVNEMVVKLKGTMLILSEHYKGTEINICLPDLRQLVSFEPSISIPSTQNKFTEYLE